MIIPFLTRSYSEDMWPYTNVNIIGGSVYTGQLCSVQSQLYGVHRKTVHCTQENCTVYTGKQYSVHRKTVQCTQENCTVYTGKQYSVHRKTVQWTQENCQYRCKLLILFNCLNEIVFRCYYDFISVFWRHISVLWRLNISVLWRHISVVWRYISVVNVIFLCYNVIFLCYDVTVPV